MWRLALIVVSVAAAPVLALTPEQKCQDGIALAGLNYFKARQKALAQCEDRQAAGDPASCAPTDAAVADALAKARATLEKSIGGKCPGGIADVPLGSPCNGLGTVTALADCLVVQAHGLSADRSIATVYDAMGAIGDTDLRTCQKTVGKEAGKYARTRMKVRRKCARSLLDEKIAGPCPDAPAAAQLDKALEKFGDKILKKCTDAQVGDLDFGLPCDAYDVVTFDRDGATNNNALPPVLRLVRCLAAATASGGDSGHETVFPLPDAAPFSYGLAAGDAIDTGFVAWTRTDEPGDVTLEVADDPTFLSLVSTTPGLTPDAAADDTVKAEVTGLAPATTYYYRFAQGAERSRTGRVRTAPLPASTDTLTFGWTGDSNAFFKPFTVLDGLVRDDPDLWLYIGDTIYGDDPRSGTGVAVTRGDYHGKYRENRDDRALRDLMAAAGTVTIWDDHEVTNDFHGTDASIAAQIDAGNTAFQDWMPIREDASDPKQLYRSFRWGQAAEFFLIDDRQYRSPPADVTEPTCAPGGVPELLPADPACLAEIADPARTYLGAAQKAWLKAGLQGSTATFKFVMNGPLLTSLLFLPYDRWEGYKAERDEMLEFIESSNIKNVVFLSTDIHAAIVNDDVPDPAPAGPVIIRELVAGAIGMDTIFRELPAGVLALVGSLPALFPTVSYFDIDRFNYALVSVSPTELRLTYRDVTGGVISPEIVIPAAP